MNLKRRGLWVTGLLLGIWLLVVGWQVEEHRRVVETAKSDLRGSSHEIASTLSAVTRAFQFRGTIVENGLNSVLSELVRVRTNALVKSSGLLAVGLLNSDGDPVVTAGNTNLIAREAITENERWSEEYVTFALPIEVGTAGVSNNAPVVVPSPSPRDFTNGAPRGPRDFQRREPRPEDASSTNGPDFGSTNFSASLTNGGMMPPPDNGNRPRNRGRPPWLRGMTDAEFKAYAAKHELHGLVLAMSTDTYRAVSTDDLWLRCIICFFAAISAVGAGLAWRNIGRTADLQIRLVRASELNSHLKELNLAAAGLAHETRNPLNIIRGQAQMISRLPDAAPEVREKSRTIVDETDKVTAQLTEFINYSRPREVRRTRVALAAAAGEIVRTLGNDIEEKKLQVEVNGDTLSVEADEQLLRQVLFNLLINAIQAAGQNGKIQIVVQRAGPTEATVEVRDDGPGVPPENRHEIFKPYFTTHQKGTGLGLAVVQQIVLAHGWEIVCLGNEPRGAIFRITHLKIAA
ncbi:MAG TPA: ATP-binding protein [Verrucomicrobiae bacterium]|jgi:signal transduction histidine kinase|nr:ATP-binding protein [Verrucomicrobiae bacterium]